MYNYEGKGVATLGEVIAKKVNVENKKGKQAAHKMKEEAKHPDSNVGTVGNELFGRMVMLNWEILLIVSH
jgi:hypothetical protein